MASRNFYSNHQALEHNIVHLFARVDIGATGAPTLDTSESRGVASISRTDTGDYTITLDDTYNRLLSAQVMMLEADDTDLLIRVTAQDTSSAKTVSISCTAAATPADPPSGSDLYIHLTLKNSSV